MKRKTAHAIRREKNKLLGGIEKSFPAASTKVLVWDDICNQYFERDLHLLSIARDFYNITHCGIYECYFDYDRRFYVRTGDKTWEIVHGCGGAHLDKMSEVFDFAIIDMVEKYKEKIQSEIPDIPI